MNKQLAQKLKDAGFPQTFPQKDFLELHDAIEVQRIYDKYPEQFDPYQPTLSELIEACGELFYGLHKMVNGEWLAFMYDIEDSTRQVETRGSTPEEAVANLYLELNKK